MNNTNAVCSGTPKEATISTIKYCQLIMKHNLTLPIMFLFLPIFFRNKYEE